ncbi:hypothetical protein [Streptomyces sp. NPDC050121]|uniref:hypothetical protein n=1 Tax=Streptomyces sp. NPDC050121 TaxID=3365601 RepID=UPI0037936232
MNLLPATDGTTAKRTHRQSCLHVASVTMLLVLAVADVLIAVTNNKFLWSVFLLLSLGLPALPWPSAHRPAWATPHCEPPSPRLCPSH